MKTIYHRHEPKRATRTLITYANYEGQTAWSFAQSHLGFGVSLTDPLDSITYIDEQRRSRSDCAKAQSDLILHCSRIIQ